MHQSFETTVSAASVNSGDFDVLSSKSGLKAPHYGDSQLVKPLQFSTSVCYTAVIFAYVTKIPVINRDTVEKIKLVFLVIFYHFQPNSDQKNTNS